MADDRIDLTHTFNQTTGDINKTEFVENSDDLIKKAQNRLAFFRNITADPSIVKPEDTISGYDNITKKDIIEKVNTITNFEE
jgi:hypothetical protein